MMSPLRALLVCSPLLLAACTSQVIGGALTSGGGGSGGNGSGGSVSGSGGDGSGGTLEGLPNAVAMSRAQADVAWDLYWQTHGGDSGSSSSSGGGDLDPSDLFLRFSNLGEACSLPITQLSCGGNWEVILVVPPSLQQVGVYDLSDPLLTQYSLANEAGAPNSPAPDDCSWGGGSLGNGTLEILGLTETQVHFRVTLTQNFWEHVQGGEYTAERCP